MIAGQLEERGWATFPPSNELSDWIDHVDPIAHQIANDERQRRKWLRHGETWFAGVNCLGASPDGSVAGGPPFPGHLLKCLDQLGVEWHGFDPGQISVCYPGYPQRDSNESDAAWRFRRHRDAAHVDGLLRKGDPARRYLGEHHAFILGIPLAQYSEHAAPMVVWDGSHRMISAVMQRRLKDVAPEYWGQVDLTDDYVAARRACLNSCKRMPLVVPKGSAYLLHRWALHGVAPWTAGQGERAIVYFRPHVTHCGQRFLGAR